MAVASVYSMDKDIEHSLPDQQLIAAFVKGMLKAGPPKPKAQAKNAYAGHIELVQPVIVEKAGASVGVEDTFSKEDIDAIKRLLNEGKLNLKEKDKYGFTVLHRAAAEGRTETVRLLLAAGAEVDEGDKHRLTALFHAAHRNQGAVVKLLILAGADVMAKGYFAEQDETALHTAAVMGHSEIAKQLLEAGAEVNAKTYEGKTALLMAAEEGQSEVVQLLLKAGAEVNTTVRYGVTPLFRAAEAGHRQVVQLLIAAGANLEAQQAGRKPIHQACAYRHVDISCSDCVR